MSQHLTVAAAETTLAYMELSNPSDQNVSESAFETDCAHFAEDPIAQGGGAVPPIHQSSTFVYPNAEAFERRRSGETPYPDYTRAGNPTTAILEAKLARLEKGSWARCFASGMGAITAAINSVTHAGAHVVAVRQCYGPTHTYLTSYINRFGVETTFVDSCDPADFIAAMRDNTRLIYLESPTTGHFEVLEIEPITAAARARKIKTIFDNSWATPYFQTPLEMGCDLIVHSATKYIGGHSDLVAGAVVGRDERLCKRILREAELLGATLDPFASWLLIRGLRTLAVRMEHVQRSGLAIAGMLESHPRVHSVNHPGLESHPQHATARKQMRGYASLFSFRLTDQSREATYRFIDRLELFQIGVSWGGHESLVVGGSLFSIDPAKPDWIIRLYVGLEAIADLMADVKRALED